MKVGGKKLEFTARNGNIYSYSFTSEQKLITYGSIAICNTGLPLIIKDIVKSN